jgi:hypothetical protein
VSKAKTNHPFCSLLAFATNPISSNTTRFDILSFSSRTAPIPASPPQKQQNKTKQLAKDLLQAVNTTLQTRETTRTNTQIATLQRKRNSKTKQHFLLQET